MKKIQLILSALIAIAFFVQCSKSDDVVEDTDSPQLEEKSFSGLIEKGPFVRGSTVTVSELDESLVLTGRNFTTQITGDDGSFSIDNIELASKYVQLTVDGYYFDEVRGQLSDSKITLMALADISSRTSVNVNLLTSLQRERVVELMKAGDSFSEAKEKSLSEILNAFNIEETCPQPEEISITSNNQGADILLAVSTIMLSGNSEAELTELLSQFSDDLKGDGTIDTESISDMIVENSAGLARSIIQVKENIETRYEDLGRTVEVGSFENFIDFDGDGTLYGDEETQGQLPVASEEEAADELTACYELTQELTAHVYVFDALFASGDDEILDLDDDWAQVASAYFNIITPANSKVEKLWNDAYQVIYKCNRIIGGSSAGDQIGQALTLRGNAYLLLANWFGKAALDLNHYAVPATPEATQGKEKAEILDAVVDDLIQALPLLGEGALATNTGFVFNKETAQLLLMRAYLEKSAWSDALEIGNAMINSGEYSLTSNRQDVFTVGSSGSTEIFAGFVHETQSDLDLLYDQNSYVPFARFTEVYLAMAECNLNVQNLEEAANYINTIIERGQYDLNGDGVVGSYDMAQVAEGAESMKSILRLIWSTEFKQEGQKLVTRKRLGYDWEGMEDYKLVLPIPQSALDNNGNLSQNPGY